MFLTGTDLNRGCCGIPTYYTYLLKYLPACLPAFMLFYTVIVFMWLSMWLYLAVYVAIPLLTEVRQVSSTLIS